MSNIRPAGAAVTFMGKQYNVLFTCNVIDQIVDRFDIDINNLSRIIASENRKRYGNCAAVLTMLLNEAIEIENEEKPDEEKQKLLDESYVKRHISNRNYAEMLEVIVNAYTLSFLKKDDDDIEQDPNRTSGSE